MYKKVKKPPALRAAVFFLVIQDIRQWVTLAHPTLADNDGLNSDLGVKVCVGPGTQLFSNTFASGNSMHIRPVTREASAADYHPATECCLGRTIMHPSPRRAIFSLFPAISVFYMVEHLL